MIPSHVEVRSDAIASWYHIKNCPLTTHLESYYFFLLGVSKKSDRKIAGHETGGDLQYHSPLFIHWQAYGIRLFSSSPLFHDFHEQL
jgi:hypothetical protein